MKSKPSETDPNFPPPRTDTVDQLLKGLGKPFALDVKKTAADSSGLDAAQYQAAPHAPPARGEHHTIPNARVIVAPTPVPQPAHGALEVTPEERERLDEMVAEHRKALEEPLRRSDPPAVQTDPRPRKNDSRLAFVLLGAAPVLLLAAWWLWPHHERSDELVIPSATATTVKSVATEAPAPSVTFTAPTVATPVTTMSAGPTATGVRPKPTVPATTTAKPIPATATSDDPTAPDYGQFYHSLSPKK